MHYDLTDLKVFAAVADEQNVSRGAARCCLSPSSVSLRLKGLEEAIGTPLFVRRARGVELTPAGTVMLEHVRRCQAQLEQMHADLLPFAQGIKGRITLFANNNAISSHLPVDLARFFARHPAVREARVDPETPTVTPTKGARLAATPRDGLGQKDLTPQQVELFRGTTVDPAKPYLHLNA